MLSQSVQAFQARVAASPDVQKQLDSIKSLVDLISIASEQGIELTPGDFQVLAQLAYEQFIFGLNGSIRLFFEQAQSSPELNQKIKQCQTPEEAIALGQEYGFNFTQLDLEKAAEVAKAIVGFSFEKLWLRNLGRLKYAL